MTHELIDIIPPTECPCCNSKLVLINDQLFCQASDCSAKGYKQVEHYLKSLKIKGFGPKTVEKLELRTIPEIYTLTESFLKDTLGDTMGAKLFNSLEASFTPPSSAFFAAFSIPLLGKTASAKLALYADNFDEITPEVCESAGLGNKLTSNLLEWIENVWYGDQYFRLMDTVSPQSEKAAPASSSNKELNITVVITGKLNDFKNRTDAASHLTSLGFTVKSSVSKLTNYLVSEEGRSSSSVKKAESLNIPIVSIKDLEKLIQHDI